MEAPKPACYRSSCRNPSPAADVKGFRALPLNQDAVHNPKLCRRDLFVHRPGSESDEILFTRRMLKSADFRGNLKVFGSASSNTGSLFFIAPGQLQALSAF
jgi:hypothetical protein